MKPSWRRLLGLLLVMSALIATAACGGDDDDEAPAGDDRRHERRHGRGGRRPADDRPRHEELHRAVHPRRALHAGARSEGLHGRAEERHRLDGDHRHALTSGQINMYPEYTGTSLTVVFGQEGSEETAEATYDAAKTAYEERGQTLLEMTPFSDSDAIAVLKETADAGRAPDGGRPEEGRGSPARRPARVPDACPGSPRPAGELRPDDIEFVPFAGISPYEALDQKQVEAAAIFSTDPPLNTGKYVVLEDTEAQFGFQNIAPVVDQELADELGQEFADAVNAVSALLTERVIIRMNSAVAIDQSEPAEVARIFLEANGLL